MGFTKVIAKPAPDKNPSAKWTEEVFKAMQKKLEMEINRDVGRFYVPYIVKK